jgi:hypothetical protein
MKAKLFTYSTEKLNSTERSILSKRINGYLDKSNRARYTYKRDGIVKKVPHIKVTKKTFIVSSKDFFSITKVIKQFGATIKSWDIDVKRL